MARKIDSWVSTSATIFDNEYDALLDDLRGWFIDKAKMNEAIARDTMRAIAIDLPRLREFTGIIEAISAAHPGNPVAAVDALPLVAPLDCSVIGTNTGHGHAWSRPDGVKARCGGRVLCFECGQNAQLVARCEAAAHVEPAHDIATLTPEQVLDQARGYTRGEQPFVDIGHDPNGACEHGVWLKSACEPCGRERSVSIGEPVIHSPSDRDQL